MFNDVLKSSSELFISFANDVELWFWLIDSTQMTKETAMRFWRLNIHYVHSQNDHSKDEEKKTKIFSISWFCVLFFGFCYYHVVYQSKTKENPKQRISFWIAQNTKQNQTQMIFINKLNTKQFPFISLFYSLQTKKMTYSKVILLYVFDNNNHNITINSNRV